MSKNYSLTVSQVAKDIGFIKSFIQKLQSPLHNTPGHAYDPKQ